ncbi:MAG: hypothetical protein LUD76_06665 [Alistipes sp.]|nr:hypothetical protein [Alistipes sp.]
MLDNWQRIEKVLKWAGAASVSAFAREIGLNRGENLYQIKRGNNGISRELAENITAKYPAVSKAWLLTGEGEMLPGKALKEKYDIPFYKTDAAEIVSVPTAAGQPGASQDLGRFIKNLPEPSYYVSLPMMKGCHFAAITFSDAMAPEIPCGSTMFFRHIPPETLTPGGMYLVVSKKFCGVRYIRREPSSENVRLVPKNIDNFDEISVPMAEIDELFQVKGVLINK